MTEAERTEQREAALQLLGEMVRFAHEPPGRYHLCVLVDVNGMLELMGWSGRFAPHVFVPRTEDLRSGLL